MTDAPETATITVFVDELDDVRDFLSLPSHWRERIVGLIKTHDPAGTGRYLYAPELTLVPVPAVEGIPYVNAATGQVLT